MSRSLKKGPFVSRSLLVKTKKISSEKVCDCYLFKLNYSLNFKFILKSI